MDVRVKVETPSVYERLEHDRIYKIKDASVAALVN